MGDEAAGLHLRLRTADAAYELDSLCRNSTENLWHRHLRVACLADERVRCDVIYDVKQRHQKARLILQWLRRAFCCWFGLRGSCPRRRQLLRRHQVSQDSLHCFFNASLRRQAHSCLVCFDWLEGFQL